MGSGDASHGAQLSLATHPLLSRLHTTRCTGVPLVGSPQSSIVHTPSHTWPAPTCSELLDRLQTELEAHWPLGYTVSLSSTFRDIAVPHEILPSLFQGRLSSKVRRVSCVCTVKGLSQLWFIPHLTYRFCLGFLIPLPPSLLLHFLR